MCVCVFLFVMHVCVCSIDCVLGCFMGRGQGVGGFSDLGSFRHCIFFCFVCVCFFFF